MLVEITGGGQTKTQAHYSNSQAVQLIENYGQLKVTHATTNKPIAKAYVKVYAQRPDGSPQFYKDGFTDLRGRFDYSSLNTNELDAVSKFSVLVMSDEHGAIVKEANPTTFERTSISSRDKLPNGQPVHNKSVELYYLSTRQGLAAAKQAAKPFRKSDRSRHTLYEGDHR